MAPSERRAFVLLILAGHGCHLIAERRQARHGDAAHASRCTGHDHRAGSGPEAILLQADHRQRGREAGGADGHHIDGGEALWNQRSLMNVPARSSATACRSCVLRVHHDRSIPGDRLLDRLSRDEQEPDALVAGLHDDFVAAVEQHERSVAGLGSRFTASLPVDLLGQHAARLRRVAERAGAREHVRERVP